MSLFTTKPSYCTLLASVQKDIHCSPRPEPPTHLWIPSLNVNKQLIGVRNFNKKIIFKKKRLLWHVVEISHSMIRPSVKVMSFTLYKNINYNALNLLLILLFLNNIFWGFWSIM